MAKKLYFRKTRIMIAIITIKAIIIIITILIILNKKQKHLAKKRQMKLNFD